MTCRMKLETSSLLTFARKLGLVSSSESGTAESSDPARPKYVVRNSLSSVLLLSGLDRLLKAVMTSSRGRIVGLVKLVLG